MAREDRADLGPVSREGDEVRARRERAGLHKNELADLAGVSRETVAAIEAGEGFRRSSLAKIENALTAFEELHGITAPPRPTDPAPAAPRVVTFHLTGSGIDVALTGPVEDLAELQATVQELLRTMGDSGKDPSSYE